MLARHSLTYMVGRVLTGLLGLLSIVVFTRVLTPSQYGVYALIAAAGGLISAVVFQWLRQGLVRFTTGDCERDAQLNRTVLWTFAALVLITAVGAGSIWALFLHDGRWGAILVVTCLAAWGQAWFELNLDAARARFFAVRYNVSTFLRALLTLCFGVIGAYVGGVYGLIIGLAVAYGCASLLLMRHVWDVRVLPILNGGVEQLKPLITYGFPLALTLALVFVVDSADRYMLAWLKTTEEVGIYAAAYNLARFSLGAILASVNLAGYPLAIKALEENGEAAAKALMDRYLYMVVGVGLPAATGMAILAPGLAKVLLGDFNPVTSPLIVTIISIAIFIAGVKSYYLDVSFMLGNKTGWQAGIAGAAAITNVVLNILLIPRQGVVGAAIATLAAFGVGFILSLVIGRKIFKLTVFSLSLAKVFIADLIMGLALLAFRSAQSLEMLVMAVVIGIIAYSISLIALNPNDIRPRLLRIGRSYSLLNSRSNNESVN